ncbi:uncharacterized protein LOC126782563 [Argentina anserina]|uniref:uncharacterized protein LOC126782563 n=1 Tax=Argentina anserina TaxID=57926 RepID=UPI00217669EE|nr:uncharacterized protein LOC126782563 [Potentilla anserina]
MGSWGRQQQLQQGDTYYRQVFSPKLQNRKPPHQQDSRQFGVPAWEKKFCTSVGSVPWKKLVDTKSYMYLYKDIVQWNDYAGEEAFRNAKTRFWAKINGLPCDILLLDPDMHIDEIDWNPSINTELVLDLERERRHSDDEGDGINDQLLLNLPIVATGWGDDEEDFIKKDASGGMADNKENSWGPFSDQNKEATRGWGNANFDEPLGNYRVKSANNNSGASRYNSRYRTSGVQGDFYRRNDQVYWKNGGRRSRANAGYQSRGNWNDCQQV